MAIERWNPSRTYTRQENWLLKRLRRTRKLFAFLRDHRHEIFDEAMQVELESMYRDSGAGKDPVCPAMMAMATLMQGYLSVSDAEAVELTVVDLRWQMVLDRLGCEEPAFSQGALFEFRERLIRSDTDRRLLLHKQIVTARGRARLGERVVIEHGLAHLTRRQGRRARCRGTRKNLFDVRRAATVQHLETIHRQLDHAATGGLRRVA